ncbi:MAG: response regulator [Spirochaetales bacterium]
MAGSVPFRVYYLDDEEGLLEVFQEAFDDDDREVKVFSNVEAALDAVRSQPPDLMVLDYRLPGASGEEIARQMDPAIPKVLVSGDFLCCDDHPAFVRVLAKPVPVAEYLALFALLQSGQL